MPTTTTKPAALPAFVRRIERSNRRFEKATRPEKIVMVAKDVLSLLDMGRMTATHGTYFAMNKMEVNGRGKSCQLSDLLKMPEAPTCNVCAIGAGMVAATMRLNNVEVPKDEIRAGVHFCWYETDEVRHLPSEYLRPAEGMSSRANEVFGDDLLKHMERAFEGGEYGYGDSGYAEDRLRAIYQNLIDNDGKKFTYYKPKRMVVVKVQA